MKPKKLKTPNGFLLILIVFTICLFSACSSDTEEGSKAEPYDPSKSVSITSFNPKEGSAGQRLIVFGENFGNDTSIVDVFIGGKKAPLVNVLGDCLYCLVPKSAFGGEIKVSVGSDESDIQEAVAADKFNYLRKMVVGTLVGYQNPNNDQGWHEGSFDIASGFNTEGTLTFDPLYPNRLYYVADRAHCVQLIDLESREVNTIIHGQGLGNRFRNITFTNDGQYMILSTDQNNAAGTAPCVYIIKRNDDGTFSDDSDVRLLGAYRQCNGAQIHPINGELYFNSYTNGELLRIDMDYYFEVRNSGGTWKPNFSDGNIKRLFTVQDKGWEFQIWIHPTGRYAYLIVINKHYILRTDYNQEKKEFAAPYIVAGQIRTSGWVDGVGTDTRLAHPYQGVFVKNPDYVKEGRDDVYDFYFVEGDNSDVRKLTPDGIVSTYAGPGDIEGGRSGYANGDLRTTARFSKKLSGIAYDEANNTFYLLDAGNCRVRTISAENEE